MENKASFILVGVFVISLFFGTLGFILWLGDFTDKASYKMYKINTKESVSGLNEKAPVKLLGVAVGEVEKTYINPKTPEEVSIIIKVKANTPIKEDTYATIEFQGITGLKFVLLQGGSSQSNELKTSDNIDKMAVIYSKSSFISKFDDTVNEIAKGSGSLFSNIQKLSEKLNYVLSNKNIRNLEIILENGAKISTSLEKTSKKLEKIDEILQLAEATEKQIITAMQDISKTSNNFSSLLDQKAYMALQNVHNAAESLKVLAQGLHKNISGFEGEGDGVFSSAQSAILEMKNLMIEASELVKQLQKSPSNILYKSTPQKPGPGEKK